MKKVQRQFTEQERIFANYITVKNLVSGLYKELQKLNNKKATQIKNKQKV